MKQPRSYGLILWATAQGTRFTGIALVHGITDWLGSEGTFKGHPAQPHQFMEIRGVFQPGDAGGASCRVQGQLQPPGACGKINPPCTWNWGVLGGSVSHAPHLQADPIYILPVANDARGKKSWWLFVAALKLLSVVRRVNYRSRSPPDSRQL